MIQRGSQASQGATWDGDGVNFALFSENAEAVELCLFDPAGFETKRYELPECKDGVWAGYLPNCAPGQLYGYRVRGPYDPSAGLRFNPNKLLLDPYAKALAGEFRWRPEVYGFDPDRPDDPAALSSSDSAPFVPKAVVVGERTRPKRGPHIPWAETILYETHVRGYTMRHPAVPAAERGKFAGMRNREVLAYLRSLGVTSVELMPIQAFLDEKFLCDKGLRNYWGYNTIGFFAPEPRYLGGSIDEFRDMVEAIHDAGLEVVLDVVYNHTAEGNQEGPTICFRGIDNPTYYRLMPHDSSKYVNDTGCGNTTNVDHAQVRRLILDSLRYWVTDMGVDGFRFDLAPILGRTSAGYDREHAFFSELETDPVLSRVKLIAEPWDVGPGGYQLGNFPSSWAEWNDHYRDTLRQFWRGDAHQIGEFANVYLGSAERFETSNRGPWATVNYIASHDGFTLADVVAYEQRHNEANGEENRDGHQHNHSYNYGVEGPTDDPAIGALRRRQRLNMLATVLLSQGSPMLLAGDEFGNSQAGNNNAYPQDNETGWLDWSGLAADPDFQHQARALIRLRREVALLHQTHHLHGYHHNAAEFSDIEWLGENGERLSADAWQQGHTLSVLLCDTEREIYPGDAIQAVAVLFNTAAEPTLMQLPRVAEKGEWHLVFATQADVPLGPVSDRIALGSRSLVCLLFAESLPKSLAPREV